MGAKTAIEWTDSTWNPIRGCSRVSEGCRNCYAEGVAARFSGPGQAYDGLASFRAIGAGVEPHWTGTVRLIEERLEDPLRWRAPRKIFVNSMSDLFHEDVASEWVSRIFEVMAKAPQHTYQILTKRPMRMFRALAVGHSREPREAFELEFGQKWPPRNWWFGVSVEDQKSANERLPILAMCGALVHFASYEPALGPVNWHEAMPKQEQRCAIGWIIVGGESGPRARPMHPGWARTTRQFCSDYQIPFFFKQWGEYIEVPQADVDSEDPIFTVTGPPHTCCDHEPLAMMRVGKHSAGAILDGREHKEFPKC